MLLLHYPQRLCSVLMQFTTITTSRTRRLCFEFTFTTGGYGRLAVILLF